MAALAALPFNAAAKAMTYCERRCYISGRTVADILLEMEAMGAGIRSCTSLWIASHGAMGTDT